MQNVSIETGGNYANVQLGSLIVNFSYATPISFALCGVRVTRENDWGPTTGKHLNAVDGGDKSSRLPGDEFEQLLSRVVGVLNKLGSPRRHCQG